MAVRYRAALQLGGIVEVAVEDTRKTTCVLITGALSASLIIRGCDPILVEESSVI